jgi:hypothetical protein
MEQTLLKSIKLEQAQTLFAKNQRISAAIASVLNEEMANAADELVELAEEILHQMAAVAIAHYLGQPRQMGVYNDFLIQLFNSSGHDYNAGPIYRWAANMVREVEDFRHSARGAFFWDGNGEKEVLCNRVHRLAELRNAVMHGFFVLPPDRNREEADHIGALLLDLHACRFFDVPARFHFFSQSAYTGRWNVTAESQWDAFQLDTPFAQLARQILEERTAEFWQHERSIGALGEASKAPAAVRTFYEGNTTGAFACWVHPKSKKYQHMYADIAAWLYAQPGVVTIAYRMNGNGISYTGQFLLQRLQDVLDPDGKINTKNKKPADWLPAMRKAVKEKVVVLVEGIHCALFSPHHITQFVQLLQQNNILLVAVGLHHRALDRYFNESKVFDDPEKVVLPELKEVIDNLQNYLRFKGPSRERADERADAQALENLLESMHQELKAKGKIVARRFADEYQVNIEYVHEIMDVLAPWLPLSYEKFEADTVDERFGLPNEMTEVTAIYLALGRRDLKLEYTHKVLKI